MGNLYLLMVHISITRSLMIQRKLESVPRSLQFQPNTATCIDDINPECKCSRSGHHTFSIIKAPVDYGKQEHPNYLVILTQVPNLFKYPNSDTKQSRHSPGAKKQQLISYTILYKLLLREYFV